MNSDKKYPFTYKNENEKDVFVFKGWGSIIQKIIPPKGMARYLFDKGEFNDLVYMFINEYKQNLQMNAIERDDRIAKIRDRYYPKNEKSTVTKFDCELNEEEEY